MIKFYLLFVVLLRLKGCLGFFKLCSYNVHDGGHGLEEMFEVFFRRYCEVAVVNEANKWRRNGAETIAKNHDFILELLETPFGYDIGVLVRSAIAIVQRGNQTVTGRNEQNSFHHGVLHCVLTEKKLIHHKISSTPLPEETKDQKVHILATHLSPHSAARRREESTRLLRIIKTIEAQAEEQGEKAAVVLAGDLNTLSPLDHYAHDEQLMKILRSNPRLCAKFFVEPKFNSIIDYKPMKILLEDLTDVAFKHSLNHTLPQPTVPTAFHADDLHAAPMRIDYVLLNAQAVASIIDPFGHAIHIHTQIDDYTKRASDHYPLIVDLPSKKHFFKNGHVIHPISHYTSPHTTRDTS
mmetsp:Transcript_12527/g.18785  ORF Transcript_12527/g.18785 Transcript_12527/m.18785 type:complete len:352 (-) Transcript_12527:143-1198(-)